MRTALLFSIIAFVIVTAISSCSLPHVAPISRSEDVATRAAVLVESSCYQDGEWPIDWTPARSGTGVVLSDYYVLTASHVVSCPFRSYVKVTLKDGRRFRAVVERDDVVFGSGYDVARLRIVGELGLHIAPPLISSVRPVGDIYYAATLRGKVYGAYDPYFFFMRINTRSGDSGSGIYNESGNLVGIVISSGVFDDDGTGVTVSGYAPIGAGWLDNT